MLKGTSFLDIKRKTPGYRPAAERVRDFSAVEKALSEADTADQALRCMDCGTPFCHGQGCPLYNLPPEWSAHIFRRQWKKALDILLEKSNFPEFTARLCPALCEASCVLALNAEPVAVRQIELFLIEKGFSEGWIRPRTVIKRTGKKAAVIGSGPAGLAAADELNKKGHRVTVYDSQAKPGGMLRYGIPDFKLEKHVLDRRIDLLKAEGVVFECGVEIGVDISSKYLLGQYYAICLAAGARRPRDLNIPGRELQGIHFALDYLIQQNRLLANEPPGGPLINAKGKRVVVIGGGDTGADCIGTAWRQGALSVTQVEILPKPPEARLPSNPWPQWPLVLRSSSSHEEGGERRWSISTERFIGKGGKVAALECRNSDNNTVLSLEADLVLLAMGFVGPDPEQSAFGFPVKLTAAGFLERDADNRTSLGRVYAAGDAASGPSLVTRAIADGRKTALTMDRDLSGRNA